MLLLKVPIFIIVTVLKSLIVINSIYEPFNKFYVEISQNASLIYEDKMRPKNINFH